MQQNNRLESFRRFNLTSSAAAGEELQSSRSKNVGSTRKKKSCGFYINRTHIPYIKELDGIVLATVFELLVLLAF